MVSEYKPAITSNGRSAWASFADKTSLVNRYANATPAVVDRTLKEFLEEIILRTGEDRKIISAENLAKIRRIDEKENPIAPLDDGATSTRLTPDGMPFTAFYYVFPEGSKVPIHLHQRSGEFQCFFDDGAQGYIERFGTFDAKAGTILGITPTTLHGTRVRQNTAMVIRHPDMPKPVVRRLAVYIRPQEKDDYHVVEPPEDAKADCW